MVGAVGGKGGAMHTVHPTQVLAKDVIWGAEIWGDKEQALYYGVCDPQMCMPGNASTTPTMMVFGPLPVSASDSTMPLA
jgi:hypothetical protein